MTVRESAFKQPKDITSIYVDGTDKKALFEELISTSVNYLYLTVREVEKGVVMDNVGNPTVFSSTIIELPNLNLDRIVSKKYSLPNDNELIIEERRRAYHSSYYPDKYFTWKDRSTMYCILAKDGIVPSDPQIFEILDTLTKEGKISKLLLNEYVTAIKNFDRAMGSPSDLIRIKLLAIALGLNIKLVSKKQNVNASGRR